MTSLVLRDGELVSSGPAVGFAKDALITAMVGRAIEQLYPQRSACASAEVALEARMLTYPGAIANVTFTVHKGEVLGLGGLMGSGRSGRLALCSVSIRWKAARCC